MTPQAGYHPLPEDPAKRFVEAYGGYVMAPAFLIALLVLLSLLFVTPVWSPPKSPDPIRVVLNEPPPPAVEAAAAATPLETEAAAADPVSPAEPPPFLPSEPQRTVAEDAVPDGEFPETTTPEIIDETETASAPQADPAQAQSGDPAVGTLAAPDRPEASGELEQPAIPAVESTDLGPPPAAAPLGQGATDQAPAAPSELASDEATRREMEKKEAQRRAIQEIASRRQGVAEMNKEVGERGSESVADRLATAQVQQKAKKWLTTTDGAEQGVIRSLVTDDVPAHVVDEVFGRYNIKITYQYIDRNGGNEGYSFLNQAKTASGTYYNRVGSGMFQVFSFGEMAVRRMVQLQAEEMKRRGLDPANTRVIEVEYGIIPSVRGHDLGIRKLKAMPLDPGGGADAKTEQEQ